MSSPIECDSCGAILRYGKDAEFYCPNEECTGILANVYQTRQALQEALKEDVVNEPNHYKLFGTVEVIDMIKTLLTEEEFKGYLKGNCLKYRLRAGKKDNVEQDIAKALRYEEWLTEGD